MPFLPPNQQRQSTEGDHGKPTQKFIVNVVKHVMSSIKDGNPNKLN